MSDSRNIDKALFASGLQCAKRLYLDYHRPAEIPELSGNREQLAEVGGQLLQLARQAFPRGIQIEGRDLEARVAATREHLLAGKPAA